MTLTRLAHSVVLAWGWRRILIAFLGRCCDNSRVAPLRDLARRVSHISCVGLADRRRRRRTPRRRGDGRDHGLVVRVRIFRDRPLLDRQCLSGRCEELRLAATVRDSWVAGLPGFLSCARAGAGAADLEPGRHADTGARFRAHARRVAPGAPAYGFPLERLWLRADVAARPGARGSAGRPVGHDVSGGGGVRVAGGSRRRSRRYPPPVACTGAERRRARRAGDLWLGPARGRADELCRKCSASHHAAEPAAG